MRLSLLLAVPCAIALLLGGVQLWPTAGLTAARPFAQEIPPSQEVGSPSKDPVESEADLQARYQHFLAAQHHLTVPSDPTLGNLQRLFDARERLRQQGFTPAEQDQLFAEDRLMEQLTLRRKALAQADEADKTMLASELDLWLAEQPQWFRDAEANSRLLGELQAMAQLPPSRRDALLLERAGPEAVDRLHQLQQNQQAFNRQFTGYLAELKQLPASARADQQQDILARWFEPNQWRRVEALSRLQADKR